MKGNSLGYRIKKDFQRNWSLYLLVLPVIIFYAIFMYKPMYGAIIAFKDYTPAKGVFGSEWVGMENFTRFFSSPYFGRLLRNTLLLSIYSIIFGFPAPIILALLLNEVKGKKFKKVSQTITYLPHFISLVVACGMIKDFCLTTGLFNDIIALFGGTRVPLLQDPAYFRTIYTVSSIWQEVGWGSIIYLSALSGVGSQLYEAASIDGAGRWAKIRHITFPGIKPTIMILLLMNVGNVLNAGFEVQYLLGNGLVQSVSQTIDIYVLKWGISQGDYAIGTAAGIFKSVVSIILIVVANQIAKHPGEERLF